MIKKFVIFILFLFSVLLIFSPNIGRTGIYLSSKDKKYFLSLVLKDNKKAIENMLLYYKMKDEKRNLYYLTCFLNSHENTKGKFSKKCPRNPLSLIKNNNNIYNYLEYKLSPIFQNGKVFLIRHKNDIKYET